MKAKEFAERIAEYRSFERKRPSFAGNGTTAVVQDSGDLHISFSQLKPKDALAFGQWLVAVFGEEKA